MVWLFILLKDKLTKIDFFKKLRYDFSSIGNESG